jgi:hypothetical protein
VVAAFSILQSGKPLSERWRIFIAIRTVTLILLYSNY